MEENYVYSIREGCLFEHALDPKGQLVVKGIRKEQVIDIWEAYKRPDRTNVYRVFSLEH